MQASRGMQGLQILSGAILAAALSVTGAAQTIEGAGPTKGKGQVSYVAEEQSVAASKSAKVTLHFVVDGGFHVNSHTPKSDLLIPTKLAVEDAAGVDVKTVDFPKGHEYSFAFDPKEKLDVYSGDFVLTAHVMAKPGAHTLKGLLHYQACDQAACYPPKSLPVEVAFTAK